MDVSNADAGSKRIVLPTQSWALLPIFSVIGGAWAFATPADKDFWSSLAAACALVIGGWYPLWLAITQTHWAAPLSQWRNWEREEKLPAWPYLQSGTPGAALHRVLGKAYAWWLEVGQAPLARPLQKTLLSMLVSLLVALVLGRAALLLTLLFFSIVEMSVLWHEGRGAVGNAWLALGLAGLPWLLGASLSDASMALPGLSAGALVVLIGFYALPSSVALLGPAGLAIFLLTQGHYLAAGGVLLLALPGVMLLLYKPDTRLYHKTVMPWLWAMLLLTAWVL